jgi:hypothetical protein
VSGKFWAGIALAAAGFVFALGPVVSAYASSPSLPPAPAARAAPGGGVLAGVVVYGRPWAGRPGG